MEFTANAEHWYKALDARDTMRIARTINRLESLGPSLGRPDVDSIKGSRHHNMKELRSRGGSLRDLFAFDPERRGPSAAVIVQVAAGGRVPAELVLREIPGVGRRQLRGLVRVDSTLREQGRRACLGTADEFHFSQTETS